jgi:hypothetical protein
LDKLNFYIYMNIKMSWLGDYVRSSNSVAQQNLEERESMIQGKQSQITAQAVEQANLLQTKFSDTLQESTGKFMEEMGIEKGIPGILKLGQGIAKNIQPVYQKASGFLDKASDVVSDMSKKLQRQQVEQPSDDIEMDEFKPSGGSNALEDAGFDEQDAEDVFKSVDAEGGTDGISEKDTTEEASLKDTDDNIVKESSSTGEEISGEAEDLGETGLEEAGEEIGTTLGESVGEAIGSAIPVVGWIGDLAMAITGGIDLSKVGDNPYTAMSAKIQSANTQAKALQASVSGDEFQQRLGANAPSFGSLAVRSQKVQQQIALHD